MTHLKFRSILASELIGSYSRRAKPLLNLDVVEREMTPTEGLQFIMLPDLIMLGSIYRPKEHEGDVVTAAL